MLYKMRHVVAVIVQRHQKIALFRRARRDIHDAGLWHCITGFIEPGNTANQQVYAELREETGLTANDLTSFNTGPQLKFNDEHGVQWVVHTFVVQTLRRRLVLDWEHDTYRWTAVPKAKRFCNRVSWLDEVIEAACKTYAAPDQRISDNDGHIRKDRSELMRGGLVR